MIRKFVDEKKTNPSEKRTNIPILKIQPTSRSFLHSVIPPEHNRFLIAQQIGNFGRRPKNVYKYKQRRIRFPHAHELHSP